MKIFILVTLIFLQNFNLLFAESENNEQASRILPIEEFIRSALVNDTVFEEILLDELALKYRKDLVLPAKDLVASIKSQYGFHLGQNSNESETTISLSRLFPYTGTNISAQYKTVSSAGSVGDSSKFTALISQPVARNAFGKATFLQDKIVEVEIDVIKHQITEAYEDYLATIITTYYSWYLAYENLKIGRSSYSQNLKLLDNIRNRQRSNIALTIDVNKINTQVLTKKEKVIGLEEKYENMFNFIKQAIRYNEDETLVPADPFMYYNREISFEGDYERFTQTSRTYNILNLLEEKSLLEVKKDANDLLPSTNLLLGYELEGKDIGMENPDNLLFTGISVTWPLPGQRERAEHEVSKIENRKTRLSNENKYIQLHTDLKNLFIQIKREKKLISIAQRKIALAESILKDETKNYSYGKVSLNDFIDAANRVDENKFNKMLRSVQLKILITEWLRMTDQLILKKDIKNILK